MKTWSDGSSMGGVNGDGSVGIGWAHHDGGNRTTVFNPSNWETKVVANVVFFKRLREDERNFDVPWRDASLYTVVLKSRH